MECDGISPNSRNGAVALELGIGDPHTWEFIADVVRRAEFNLFLACTLR